MFGLLRLFIMCLMVIVLGTISAYAQSPSDTVYLEQGVKYTVVQRGKSSTKSNPSTYWIRYKAWLSNGDLIEESEEQGILVNLKEEGFIRGWYILLPSLSKGDKVISFIPAAQAYGEEGQRDPINYERIIVPPNTDLRFEIEVLNIK